MTAIEEGPYRRLAQSLLRDAYDVLCKNPPPATPPKGVASKREWRKKWERWEYERQRELRFFADPSRSAPWCEMAGVDYDATVSRLERDGLLYDPKDRFPLDMGGRSLIHKDTENKLTPRSGRRPREDTTERACPECQMMCRGVRGKAIHDASCVGRQKAMAVVAAYNRGMKARDIMEEIGVSPDTLYRLLDAHGVDRRQKTSRYGTRA